MNITIVATKTCNHRALLERQLQDLGVDYTVRYVDDHPELVERHDIHQSPNLLVDDQVVFRRGTGRPVPLRPELEQLLGLD